MTHPNIPAITMIRSASYLSSSLSLLMLCFSLVALIFYYKRVQGELVDSLETVRAAIIIILDKQEDCAVEIDIVKDTENQKRVLIKDITKDIKKKTSYIQELKRRMKVMALEIR